MPATAHELRQSAGAAGRALVRATAALALALLPARAIHAQQDFTADVANAGPGFVELEWSGVAAGEAPGTIVGWIVERRPLDEEWSIASGLVEPSNGDPGPFQWLDLGLPPRLHEYRVTELREVLGVVVPGWESDVVLADSDAVAPRFVGTSGLVVIEAESWHSRAPGTTGKEWAIDTAPPPGGVGDVLVATPADGTDGCPSIAYAPLCPRVDYRVEFGESGLYYVWIRGYAANPNDAGVLVGLDGVALEYAASVSTYGAWSWGSGGPPDFQPIAVHVPNAGEHELNVWMSEDGARIDRLLMTTDLGVVPSSAGPGGGAGPPESPRRERAFVTVADRSECSQPIVVACPQDYELVGGGMNFPDKHGACADGSEPPHDKFFAYSSYPEGNGWYCRVESRLADCYALCAHRDTIGIQSTQRAETPMVNGLDSVDAFCPAGTTRIAGGYHSESFWEIPKKQEEYKVLGSYPIPGGWRCDDRSRDHYGFCYALCVDDAELVGADVVETTVPSAYEVTCPQGYRAVGASFSYCPTQDCGRSLDEVEARPLAESGVARCRVGFKDDPVEAPTACDAVCIEDAAVYVPEPAPPVALAIGLAALAALRRARERRRAARPRQTRSGRSATF